MRDRAQGTRLGVRQYQKHEFNIRECAHFANFLKSCKFFLNRVCSSVGFGISVFSVQYPVP